MCGIFGIVDHHSNATPDQRLLEQSVRMLDHRGPDSWGVHADRGIGLGMTRLALLDPNERSSQPFWDTQKQACLVYNGEVYNFKQLRAELEGEGKSFRTTSDTEVVLEAILAWGLETALAKLDGMFALALWDSVRRTVSLARDRFGIKPLFILEDAGTTIFSSEIRPFRPWTGLEPDSRIIMSYLLGSGGPTSGRTFFDRIHPLEPGTVLTLSSEAESKKSVFATVAGFVSPDHVQQLSTYSDTQLVDRTEKLLIDSVERQLVADAPVGILCSGGVDSSLLLAIATRSHDRLGAFHANVVGPTSELPAATALADHLGIDLHVVDVHDSDFIELLPRLTESHGSPYHLNPHSVPFFKVSELIRDSGFKAVLSGEGADEAYLGYPWLLPGRTRGRSNKRAADPSRTFLAPDGEGYDRSTAGQIDLVSSMLSGFVVDVSADINAEATAVLHGADGERARQSLDLMNSNLRGLLHRNDTMGMAASIESRFPYLDERLIGDSVNMPASAKIRRGLNLNNRQHPFSIDKWVLRRVADRYLPRGMSRRRKIPFSTTAYGRLHVTPRFFADGFVASQFALGVSEIDRLLAGLDRRQTSKLVHLETFGRVFFTDQTLDETSEHLQATVTLRQLC